MVKCIAPGAASWRGREIPIAPDGTCDLPDEIIEDMRAHGFRLANEAEREDDGESAASPNIEKLSRGQLFAWLKRRAVAVAFNATLEELRALAKEECARGGE